MIVITLGIVILGFILWSLNKGNIVLAISLSILLYNYYQAIKPNSIK
ncbi:hypothetical protein CP118TE_15660 [Clostridium perfringens E]|nr:hypothetical protein CP118TE_15660 [Clostridium perfringens E]